MIYGPFAIFTHDAHGDLTASPAPGVHYTTDADTFAQQEAVLGPYRIEPAHPLQSVMAGDDPDAPVLTVSLRFTDEAAADAVRALIA